MRQAALVALRELSQRSRDRSALVSFGITLVIVLGLAIVPGLVGGGPDRSTVALVGARSQPVGQAARALAPAADRELRLRDLPSRAAAERALRSGDLDAAVVDGRELLFDHGVDDALAAFLQQASRRARSVATLRSAGLAPGEVRRALAPPPLAEHAVQPAGSDSAKAVAFVCVFILYGQLLTYGIWVATGIVEEKGSRIVELLLAVLRPRELLVGKVVGIGSLAFAQLLVVVAVGAAAAIATGTIDVPGDAIAGAGLALAWFVLGYAFFAWCFAVAGATVARQEDLQGALTPLTITIVASFILSFSAIDDTAGTLAQVLSFLPPSAPLVMPARILAGDAGAAEIAGSVAVMLAAIAVLVPLAGRLYAGSALSVRGRISLRRAWAAAE